MQNRRWFYFFLLGLAALSFIAAKPADTTCAYFCPRTSATTLK